MVDKRRRDVIVPARFDDEAVARDIEHLSSKATSALAHERLIEITVRDLRNESAGSDPT